MQFNIYFKIVMNKVLQYNAKPEGKMWPKIIYYYIHSMYHMFFSFITIMYSDISKLTFSVKPTLFKTLHGTGMILINF